MKVISGGFDITNTFRGTRDGSVGEIHGSLKQGNGYEPKCQSRQFRTRELGNRADMKAVDDCRGDIANYGCSSCCYK